MLFAEWVRGNHKNKRSHSCASLLVAQGVQMKLIQQWLGHSNISTTANIYSHVDAASTFQCAMTIDEVLGEGK